MESLIDVASADDLTDGEMRAVTAGDRELVLARVGDDFYAADARCPHMGGRLVEGQLVRTVIVCPRHGSRFDLTDGRVAMWTTSTGLSLSVAKTIRRPRPLRTYPVLVQEGRVLVDLQPGD